MNNTLKIVNVSITILKLRLIALPIVKFNSLHSILFLLVVFFCQLNAQSDQYTLNSVLSEGEIYKISVAEEGIYKLDLNFLKNQVGIGNIESIDANQIKLYSNGGGPLPHLVAARQIDDLQEIFTYRSGLSDGNFQNGDFILFYSEGPDQWLNTSEKFAYTKNPYDDFNYLFIKISSASATSLPERATVSGVYQSTVYNDLQVINEDKINLLGKYQSPGAGTIWFGDEFKSTRSKNYDGFDFNNMMQSDTMTFKVRMAARSSSTSQFTFSIGESNSSKTISGVDITDFEDEYARFGTIEGFWLQNNSNTTLRIDYPASNPAGSIAWLDYIELNIRKKLVFSGEPLLFRDVKSKNQFSSQYTIGGANSSLELWDISNRNQPISQIFESENNSIQFGVENEGALKTFILFNPSADYVRPTFVSKVPNQNIHGLTDVDMVIVYHPDFQTSAQDLENHRSVHSGLNVSIVNVLDIYNEFGGGSQDVTSIRDFSHMLHTRSSNYRYLLLLGDGTYDYRYRNTNNDDDNFIPVYETINSLDPIFAYPTDDYYGLLSDEDGAQINRGYLNIAVGRIPCRTASQAGAVVKKIINYDSSPNTFGDWRNKILFLADDEDNAIHLDQIDGIAKITSNDHPAYNQEKVYIDAYQQISTPGGERYPDVSEAINNNVFKGVLAFNYLGHGGQEGLAQERILRAQNISGWENINKLPLFITATCSFTGFDEPIYNTAGEQAIMNPNGGVIALMTTVRAVYSGQNETLTRSVFKNLFNKVDGEYVTIGEIMRISKNQVVPGGPSLFTENARKFQVIGDPSMKLAYPDYDVVTTELNGKSVGDFVADTISALDEVNVKGKIEDNGIHLTGLDGKLFVTVFDKKLKAQTLSNDSGSPKREFDVQNRVLFKGTATIMNGSFEFSFVVPKDINFTIGAGRISYYATDLESIDARGFFEGFAVGGPSNSALVDDQGPNIELYMNDESFKDGGKTGPNPILIVKLKDDFGINVAGTSIGHDLEALLDESTQNKFLLNDFYEASIDDYTSGEARFPFFDLEEGNHKVTVTAWDIANNFSESTLSFLVTTDSKLSLSNLLNYPNPVVDNTFFKFQHNKPGAQVDVFVDIFNSSGQFVAQVEHLNVISDGNTISALEWDGKSNFGRPLAFGIYFYKIRMVAKSSNGEEIGESKFEKMVILK